MNCSLYIHIPFCKTKCDYCDFFSVSCGNSGVPDYYVESLCNEIAIKAEAYGIKSFTTVYIGGGTPSLLTVEQLNKLMGLIFSLSCKTPSEITIELNPDDITESLLKNIWNAGITRISVGIQAFDQKVLQNVKRRSSLDTVRNALVLIKKYWKGVFSADVIAALPQQSRNSFLKGLAELVHSAPHHISMYSLTVEEETPLGKRFLSGHEDYDYEAADKMWIEGRDFLSENGYFQYEVSNFSKTGYECKHNMVYWQLNDYIGCGAGATGSLYNRNFRFTNTNDIEKYVSFWKDSGDLADAPGTAEEIDGEIQQFEYFMMGLRTLKGVSKEQYEVRFNKTFPDRALFLFEQWQKKGLAFKKNVAGETFYGLNEKGILFLNAFLKDLID